MKIVDRNFLKLIVVIAMVGCLFSSRYELFDVASLLGNASKSNDSPAIPANNSTASGKDSSNSTSESGTGTGVLAGKTNSSNALGFVGPTNFSISNPPYKVKRCDQVLLIPADRITDYEDYCKKEPAFFTMSVYMVNLFTSKDSNKLIESITIDRLTTVPKLLGGAPGCLDFQASNKRISVCVKGKEQAEEIIDAFRSFMRCRMGDNLRPLTTQQMWKILADCRAGKVNTTAIMARFGNSTAGTYNYTLPGQNASLGNSSKYNPYYADMKVPGS